MPIDPDKLMSFQISAPRQTIDARDAAFFYALSLGLGQDPTSRHEIAFTCAEASNFRIFPTFALVVAHPGFWLGHPESGVDSTMVLHANQSLQILAPLPFGKTVTSRSRVSRLTDKGPGKPPCSIPKR